ncbi:hypothetical protein CL621_01080 [archaeon]|nr:hypothetical protein [archaeon]|tara:strand:- start:352 stop:687 length:336 start_codon:yes stop_codon:yes gene_type:complete
MSKQALEQIVMDELGELLGLKFNPGSGNVFGDGDLSPKYKGDSPVQLGFECKDRNVSSHSVPTKDWNKAKIQIGRRGLSPIFVTRNNKKEVMIHMDMSLFKNLLEIILDKM